MRSYLFFFFRNKFIACFCEAREVLRQQIAVIFRLMIWLRLTTEQCSLCVSAGVAGVGVCTRQKPKMNNHIFCVVQVTRNGNTRPDNFNIFFLLFGSRRCWSFFFSSIIFASVLSARALLAFVYSLSVLCALPPWRKIHHKYSKEFLFTHANRCFGHFMCVASESFRIPIYFEHFLFFYFSGFSFAYHFSYPVDGYAVSRCEKNAFEI